jgi:hypothetical protein
MPTDSRRLPNVAFEDFVGVDFVVEVDVVVVVVVAVDVGDVDVSVGEPPREAPPELPLPPDAAAGPAASAKNRMEEAASRRQPRITALEYDKPTLSLSCAYGVSCRARAERVRATWTWRHDSPQEPLLTAHTTGSPAPFRLLENGLGWVCWRAA